MINLSEFASALELTTLYAPECGAMELESSDINRPGLQLSGYFDHFAYDRIQILGKAEMTYYAQLEPSVRAERLRVYMEYRPPCVIICRSLPCPEELLALAREFEVSVFSSRQVTTKLSGNAITYLNHVLAPRVTRHGVLIEVDGVGILLTGESGIGKSESALEMIKRGHRLVADDVVDVRKVSETRLVGQAPASVRHFMEIRGVGLIDVRAMYGISAVIPSKSIDMNIHMELWDNEKQYDRLGMSEEFTAILGVQVPKLSVPVRPGRNLAIIIEVAARNYKLKSLGYNAAKEMEKRLMEQILSQQSNGV